MTNFNTMPPFTINGSNFTHFNLCHSLVIHKTCMSGYQGFTIATMPGNMLTDSIKNDLKISVISFLINADMYRIFQGSNPISDVWSKEALRICSQHMVSSINDTNNFESRKQMCAASAFAGKFLGLNTTYMYDLILHLYPVKSNILRQKS